MIKELTVYAWDYENVEEVILSQKWDKINFMWFQEFELGLSPACFEHINKNKIKIRVVTCATDEKEVKDQAINRGLDPNTIESIESWPGFWFINTHKEILQNGNLLYFKVMNNDYDCKFKYPFLTFNGRSRNHRTMLIDILMQEGLFDKGIVTYHTLFDGVDFGLNLKCYDGKPIVIDDDFAQNNCSYRFNEKFLDSFLHIPTESSIDLHLISEKTAMPILCSKPFLTLGPVNYHKKLSDLGFSLYTEIFDYSFDSEPNLELRIRKLLKNVLMVTKNAKSLDFYYSVIKPKIDHNRRLAVEMMSDRKYFPQLVLDRFDNKIPPPPPGPSTWDHTFFTFKSFLQETKERPEVTNFDGRTLYADLWEGRFKWEDVVNDIRKSHPKRIVILGENEWEPWYSDEFVDLINTRDKDVEFVLTTCSHDGNYIRNALSKNFNDYVIQPWPTFWFNYTARLLEKKAEKYNVNKNFKYPLISLNSRAHLHRCHFIESAAEQGLLKTDAVITWVNLLNENLNFPFKHYDRKSRILNDNFINHRDSFLMPKEWYQSFFDAVVECSHETIVFSEKTVKPLLFKKPFCVFGATGFHNALKEYGFELYDEIIDYSFDNEDDLKTRSQMFVASIKKVLDIKNYTDVYNILQKKIDHNYNRAIELSYSNEVLPPIVQEIIQHTPPKDTLTLTSQIKYRELMKRK